MAQEQQHQGSSANCGIRSHSMVPAHAPVTSQSHYDYTGGGHQQPTLGFTSVNRDPAPQHYNAPPPPPYGAPVHHGLSADAIDTSGSNFQQPFFVKSYRKKINRQMISNSPVTANTVSTFVCWMVVEN